MNKLSSCRLVTVEIRGNLKVDRSSYLANYIKHCVSLRNCFLKKTLACILHFEYKNNF